MSILLHLYVQRCEERCLPPAQGAGAVVQVGDVAGARRRGGNGLSGLEAVGGGCKRKFFEQPGGWPGEGLQPGTKRAYGGGGGDHLMVTLQQQQQRDAEPREDGDEDEGEEEEDANTFMVRG